MQAEDSGGAGSGIVDILLVEDEAILSMVACEVLGEVGYRVRDCASAEEAIAALDSGYRPHLAIIDHGLPQMPGSDFAGLLRQRLPETVVLIASGNVDSMDFHFPVLPKPYRDAELVERVAALLPDVRLPPKPD